ncbi:MAG: hydrogenase expression/formation protein HypE [Propionibacteriaceae bacterium]|nr:hydrogenase expression/formation protein HypE [Propionibacteriaceae bacterium]
MKAPEVPLGATDHIPRRSQFNDETITLAHGAGGKASAALIEAVFINAFGAPDVTALTDSAILSVPAGRIGFSTDSYVVNPIRFPGASIGDLAVNGTVNDLAVCGARPLWLSAAFIIEEGFEVAELRQIVADMRIAAERAGVQIVTGDTKVVPRNACDRIFITTAGVGLILPERVLGATRVIEGDKIILSGAIAAHGMAVMIARGNLAINAPISSDSAPINELVEAMYSAVEPGSIRWMRDATRGGLGTVMNELAGDSKWGILLDDEAIPIAEPVRGACEMLGIDPLYVANEGCFVTVVAQENAEQAVAALRAGGATQAGVIGEIVSQLPQVVAIRNGFGGTRLVDTLVGDPLPRIC